MLIFDILKHGSSTLNFNSSDNIARIIKCDTSKSKLALSTCNGVYFSSIALIVFTLYEIKQVKVFLGHPVVYSCCPTIICAIPLFCSILLLCYHQLCFTIILQYITVVLP